MSQPPVLDFDNSALFAYTHFITFMCWPDLKERKLRQAKFATSAMAKVSDGIQTLFNQLIDLSDTRNPKFSTYEEIMISFAAKGFNSFLIEQFLSNLSKLWNRKLARPVSSFDALMQVSRIPEIREILLSGWKEAFDATEAELFLPSGGFLAATYGPSFKDVLSEIVRLCDGPPMLADLVVTLVARMHRNHSDEFTASVNRACFILDRFRNATASTTRIKEARRQWPHVAPLWAGVIAENDYQELNLQVLSDVASDADRRTRAISYARWFAEFATGYRAQINRQPVLSSTDVMRFQISVDAREPPLPPPRHRRSWGGTELRRRTSQDASGKKIGAK
jgi:hypothetical protein